ncbi:chaperone J-domain-containing protein [Artomyces pyxidatus]|uniref:Chaperone J-domain-containing protein n=1 Tax=Artomyces pyxidatus TaxID=48021 RepID=A0ACB8TGS1_9AGAM|nr:chaperone J-domain-containing protein [Artomyces pyxidatus]
MPSATTQALFSLIGWSYIPDFITSRLLRYLRPYLRTPITELHYRITFALVVLSYLLYNFIEASRSTPPNFYELLNVRPQVDENGLKSAFRLFARKNHPDRVGADGAAAFMAVRTGYEALKDPVRRWAYDRFGPDILLCEHCATPREYLNRGLVQSMGFHIVSGLLLLFFSALGRSSGVAFWRYALFFLFTASELSLLFSPSPSSINGASFSILSVVFPTRLPFQHIRLLHQVFMFLSIALSRVAPVLFPSDDVVPEDATPDAILQKIKMMDREVYIILRNEVTSITSDKPRPSPQPATTSTTGIDDETLARLTQEMENLIIEGRLATEGGELARVRNEVLQRAGTALKKPWRRRLVTRVASEPQLPSPVSPARKAFNSRAEPIDVDALDETGTKVQREFLGEEVVNQMWVPRTTAGLGKALGKYVRARSKSC